MNPRLEREPMREVSNFELIQSMRDTPTAPFDNEREGLSMEKLLHGLSLPFNPDKTDVWIELKRFSDLPVHKILSRTRGLMLDVDETLCSHHSGDFSPEVIEKLREVKASMPVWVYSNNDWANHELFVQLGISVATNIPPKPDPAGFRVIANKMGLTPKQCAMVGDNLLTDGGCLTDANGEPTEMKFILVDPISGKAPIAQKLTSKYGRIVKAAHDILFSRHPIRFPYR